MGKRIMGLLLCTVAVSAGTVRADLVHHWRLDEDTTAGATVAVDSVGGNNGTIKGATSAEGVYGNALYFNGAATVEIANFSTANIKSMTLAFWMNPDAGYVVTGGWKRVISANDGWEAILNDNTGLIGNNLYRTGGTYATSTAPPPEGEWTHVAMTADLAPPGTGRQEVYVNGILDNTMDNQAVNDWAGGTFLLGYRASGGGEHYEGMLDDVRIYDTVLSEEEVQVAMAGDAASIELADAPAPADGATDVPRDVVLSWTPGQFARTHDVYFGTVFEDVNEASQDDPLDVLASPDQDANMYDPGRLDFSRTYYWRVDEVNAPPDTTIFKGRIWSFETEPIAYPIENVVATASSSGMADMGPGKTVDGSGLSDDDLHSTDGTAMWLSGTEPNGASIEYAFDKIYKLHEMWVWNSNQFVESMAGLGFGIKEVSVEYSLDGNDWTVLEGVSEFAQAPGAEGYAHNTTVDFGGVAAQFVRITARSNWGGLAQSGLSEVRFLAIPVQAREPQPTSGAVDVDPAVVLTWRAGREAASHHVLISDDRDAVVNGTAPVEVVGENSFDTTGLDLRLERTYYWKVNEANEAETPSLWKGDVWEFSTLTFFVVDDFESYVDDYETGEAIFEAWLDGATNNTGSTVGYWEAPFAEQTIVRGGRQSMPFTYDNTAAAYSEVSRPFDGPQDWTRAGIQTLVLYFFGDPGNTDGQLYVKINSTKVPFEDDPAALSKPEWTQWSIDLASTGANLQNVSEFSIGVDGPGAAGIFYVDDIELLGSSVLPSVITVAPVDGIEVTGDDGTVLSINGIEVSNLVLGTTTTDFEKFADHPAADADDFDLGTYASLDDSNFINMVFAVPVTTIFIVERGGNDEGFIQPLDAAGNPVGGLQTFAKSDWHKPGAKINGQAAGAIVITSEVPISGIRILPPAGGKIGLDPASICAIPAE